MEISSISQPLGTADEDIMIICSVNEIKNHFVQESLVIWYDPHISSDENQRHIEKIKSICNNIETFNDFQKATSFLSINQVPYQVIISGEDGEALLEGISGNESVISIHVFCTVIEKHTSWDSKYPKIVSFHNLFKDLLESIALTQRKMPIRVQLPAYAPIFNDFHRSENYYLHLYLKGFTHFTNWEQSKRDFIALAEEIYGKSSDITDFSQSYTQYNMKDILQWYTRECFLYKMTNNCLRIATADSILYCRLVLKDLELAIKEKYQQHSKHFSGLLYRGTYISNQEWTQLQQNVGKDIEMFGFLSTTKQKQIALEFCETDTEKKVFITIIVPGAPDRGEQGFAELKEYSVFANEDEVLFNVRSRFTVLETIEEEANGRRYRHLVLMYGAQAMKKFMAINKPSIKVQNSNENTTICKICSTMISEGFLNLSESNGYICFGCLEVHRQNKRGPLFLMSVPLSQKLDSSFELEGFVLEYPTALSIPFYGYNKCRNCQGRDYHSCYRCLTCQKEGIIYCEKCLDQTNVCLKEGHLIILESQPFSFWSEKASHQELESMEYQDQLANIPIKFQQGYVFFKTHNYIKAIEFYEKFLSQSKENTDIMTKANAYNNLGLAYQKTGMSQKFIECQSQALEMYKEVLGENHINVADSYSNLGLAYNELGEIQKAIEFAIKALEIKKAVLEDNDPSTGNSYNNIGLAYRQLGEYQKAAQYHGKALEILRGVYGDMHLNTADSYNNLGNVYSDLGEYHKAIEFQMKALEIKRAVLGDKHPNTADSYNNLGDPYINLGQYEMAIEYYLKAMEIRKAVFGNRHPSVADSYNQLGNAYNGLGKYQLAVEYYLKALDIKQVVLGNLHPDTAESFNNLGVTYYDLGEYEKAVEFYCKALEVYKTVFGEMHPNTAASYNNVGNAYSKMGEHQKAVEAHLKTLEVYKQVLGEFHPSTADSNYNLGLAYHEMGQYQNAIDFHSKALEIERAVFGENHPKTAGSYAKLGHAYKQLGEYQKAIELFLKVLEIKKGVLGDEHPSTTDSYSDLGDAYCDAGEYKKGVELLSKALEIQKKVLGDNHEKTIKTQKAINLINKGS